MIMDKKHPLRIAILGLVLSFCFTGCQSPTPPAPLPINPLEASWEDTSPFQANLTPATQNDLSARAGASIYHVDLTISSDYQLVKGTQAVRYTNLTSVPLNEIYFRLFPDSQGGSSTPSNIRIDQQPGSFEYEEENTSLRVPLTPALSPGKSVSIQFDLEIRVPTQLSGNYGLFGYTNNILSLDTFLPMIPVYDATGWHKAYPPFLGDLTYNDPSFYLVRITAPKKLIIAASGAEIGKSIQDQQQTVTYALGPARDFYIAASEAYKVVEAQHGSVKVKSYARKEDKKNAQDALTFAANALTTYEKRFGPYPYSELKIASIPMRASGIEYPGIIGISSKLFATGQAHPLDLFEPVIAHEIGHQWFYNLIGNDQNNQPWIDESFTQYVTSLYYLDNYGEKGMKSYRLSWESSWAYTGNLKKPIGLPAGDYWATEYSPIVYGRGPLFLVTLEEKMGQGVFADFLSEYAAAYRWKISNRDAVFALAEKQCACNLSPLFQDWIDP